MQFSYSMDKDEKTQIANKALESDFFLQWGNKKRLRCVRVRGPEIISQRSDGVFRRKITTRIDRRIVSPATEKEASHPQSNRLTRNSEAATLRSSMTENRKSASPEKEDRYYTTRGSMGVDENGKVSIDGNNGEDKGHVWPKLYITLSSKEKEEDFMAMKGCKLPQRPKKRAKIIQRSLLGKKFEVLSLSVTCLKLFSWYVIQRPRGLKAMGSMESDSE
ncbi:uncharacterized protein LOC110620800 isoform X2 [Manihot esculenta]|uniref:uncharacterized protein LOC110620800 isoform X2 n=1 Tax=Manihot esculenta TaxID=3983 RepID=UPI000B5D5EA6|nr:uncharacterized protein LOC110620800 isoform X2 [Manihot esculenta]